MKFTFTVEIGTVSVTGRSMLRVDAVIGREKQLFAPMPCQYCCNLTFPVRCRVQGYSTAVSKCSLFHKQGNYIYTEFYDCIRIVIKDII